MKSSQSWNRQA